ncbi:MAG: glycosyltransferase family A protein [Acetatifactor sp.]|nr:glycosyltransferase family A protein [Acetatifactor sp.]
MIYVRTCAYNSEKTLKRAIESILNQTYEDFEYHILDNGSTDCTGEIIREYASRDKRIVPYYSCKNRDFTECNLTE